VNYPRQVHFSQEKLPILARRGVDSRQGFLFEWIHWEGRLNPLGLVLSCQRLPSRSFSPTKTMSFPQVTPSMSLAAKLICKDPLFSFHEIELVDFPLRLGRGPDADVQLGDRWVSREHCEIVSAANALVVRDLGSKHGTFVNGRSVMEAELHAGDELNIGLTRFVVEYQTSAAHRAGIRQTELVS
jgi:hypothetical protein